MDGWIKQAWNGKRTTYSIMYKMASVWVYHILNSYSYNMTFTAIDGVQYWKGDFHNNIINTIPLPDDCAVIPNIM